MVLHGFKTFICFLYISRTVLSSHIFRSEMFDQIPAHTDLSITSITQVSAWSEFDCARRCFHITQCVAIFYSKRQSLCELLRLFKDLSNENITKTNGSVMWLRRCSLLTEDYGKLATVAVNPITTKKSSCVNARGIPPAA